jgi:aryl-alcohol dehydrogenase-like predicted oxidoreductase
MHENNKLCLGTVKLGIPDYGFSSGKSNAGFDAIGFLNQAESLGINKFDTSPRYGESENILGAYINQTINKPFISSKIDNLKANQTEIYKLMFESVKATLRKLHLEKLDICYLHQNEINIITDPYIHDGLKRLKEEGLIEKAGASVYSHEECAHALQCGIFDFIQVPLNVFDISFYNRFIKDNQTTVRFVARSLLLQGTLVNREQIIKRISSGNEILTFLSKLDIIARENNLSTLQMSLRFVYSLKNIDQYIIGTTSIQNLKMNTHYLKEKLPINLFTLIYELASQPKSWSNPRSW